jgi:hypothetical protein
MHSLDHDQKMFHTRRLFVQVETDLVGDPDATCLTITSRPPFTGSYIKICSAARGELEGWALSRSGTLPQRCGTCQPAAPAASSHRPAPQHGHPSREVIALFSTGSSAWLAPSRFS